jgi:hypothetical protein
LIVATVRSTVAIVVHAIGAILEALRMVGAVGIHAVAQAIGIVVEGVRAVQLLSAGRRQLTAGHDRTASAHHRADTDAPVAAASDRRALKVVIRDAVAIVVDAVAVAVANSGRTRLTKIDKTACATATDARCPAGACAARDHLRRRVLIDVAIAVVVACIARRIGGGRSSRLTRRLLQPREA